MVLNTETRRCGNTRGHCLVSEMFKKADVISYFIKLLPVAT